MTDFINEFERMYHKLKQHKMELPDGVLAYRLLKSVHLSEQHEQLARATLTELTYDNMKGQLKKIFGDPASLENVSHIPSVKVELVLLVNEREKGYYSIEILLSDEVEEEKIFVVEEEEISMEQVRNQIRHLLIGAVIIAGGRKIL